jgi:bifunctional NMN adenylyltransferase/nudix hydrolase
LIVVGIGGGVSDRHDPLDFDTRKEMIEHQYPYAVVLSIMDHPSSVEWSRRLGLLISKNFPNEKAVLFGSRDSFIPFYSGVNDCKYIEPKQFVHSATNLREMVTNKPLNSIDFRTGVIYSRMKQGFPTSFQAADVVIRHSLENKVLVGRKEGEIGWRFPGGFVDPTDSSLELAVKREAIEEIGDIEIEDMKYLSSFRINDHRYRNSEHKLMTALFSATYVFGRVEASDDLVEVRWQDFDGLVECLLPEHKILGETFLKNVSKN